eukprot:m.463368 g.463368  ORF g.463368 m.463368 type:complete len:334 (-) comp22997_c0_seq1:68-1069(-)
MDGNGEGGAVPDLDARLAKGGFRERRTLLERMGSSHSDPGTAPFQGHAAVPTATGRAQAASTRSREPKAPSSRPAAGAEGGAATPGPAVTSGAGKGTAKKKKTRRPPRRKATARYSELPWLERKRLQEEGEDRVERNHRRVAAAAAVAAATEESANRRGRGGGSRNARKRPREQPPPAPFNTVAERARVLGLPSAPHTPVVASPSEDNGAAAKEVGSDFFKDAFENAMSTLYDDMRAWDVPALITAIKGRDDIVDSLSAELNEYRDAGGAPTASFVELQALRGQVQDQAEVIEELQSKLDAQTARVQELERRFHEGRSVLDVEEAEAHAFAED